MSEKIPSSTESLSENADTRIEDIDKAHVMALASKKDEEAVAAIRYVGNEGVKYGVEGFAATLEEAEEYLPEYFKKSPEGDDVFLNLDPDSGVDGLIERINDHQNRADEQAQFAGEGYDKLQATKR